jgi:hypothetical protein
VAAQRVVAEVAAFELGPGRAAGLRWLGDAAGFAAYEARIREFVRRNRALAPIHKAANAIDVPEYRA